MGLFPNDNRALFLHQIKWLVIFMATGFVIIWIFTFPTESCIINCITRFDERLQQKDYAKKTWPFRY